MGYHENGPNNEDYKCLGSILGPPYCGNYHLGASKEWKATCKKKQWAMDWTQFHSHAIGLGLSCCLLAGRSKNGKTMETSILVGARLGLQYGCIPTFLAHQR